MWFNTKEFGINLNLVTHYIVEQANIFIYFVDGQRVSLDGEERVAWLELFEK